MNPQVSFNLQILPAEKTFLAATSSAALYGKGVFTSLAIYRSKPFLWEKHWRRMLENSARIGLDLSAFHEKAVRHALSELILLNELKNGRARLTFFDEAAGGLWHLGSNRKTSLLIMTGGFQNPTDRFRLTVSPFIVNSRSPLAGVKSCNYLESLLALEDARRRGFDESLRLNEKDEIVSASTANVFWVKDEKIYTPPLAAGCLAGTTREFLMENFPVRETVSKIEELSAADEIFLTSAGIGLRPASLETAGPQNFAIFSKLSDFFEEQKSKI